MSLILEALNRSERERQHSGDVPGLATEHYVEGSATGLPIWVLPTLVAALLVVALGLWWLWADNSMIRGVAPADPSSVDPGEAVTAAREPLVAGAASNNAAEQPRQAEVANPARPVLDAPARSIGGRDPAAGDPAAGGPGVSPGPARDAAVAQLYQQQSVAQSAPSTAASLPGTDTGSAGTRAAIATEGKVRKAAASAATEQPLDIAKLAAQAEQELQNSRAEEHRAPFLASLSQHQRDAIPTLMYSQHDYSSKVGQSSVIINGTRFQVGQSVASGVKLVEILPDSIVLDTGGTEFRLKALNSWVNL